MPNLDQPRWLVVAILVSLLVGCTPTNDAPPAEQTPETPGQGPPGLIAFVSDREGAEALFVMRPDGSGVRRLTSELPAVSHPSWSADGQRIATTRSGFPELMAVDPETGEEQTLLSHAVGGLNPAWSLDGSQLAFNVVTQQGFDIDVMSSDGDDRRSVLSTDASEERPRWSPDGKQLTYYSDAGGSWEVYTVLIATGVTRSLTDNPGFDGQPAWQPTPG